VAGVELDEAGSGDDWHGALSLHEEAGFRERRKTDAPSGNGRRVGKEREQEGVFEALSKAKALTLLPTSRRPGMSSAEMLDPHRRTYRLKK
jgi:hypothetical protein